MSPFRKYFLRRLIVFAYIYFNSLNLPVNKVSSCNLLLHVDLLLLVYLVVQDA